MQRWAEKKREGERLSIGEGLRLPLYFKGGAGDPTVQQHSGGTYPASASVPGEGPQPTWRTSMAPGPAREQQTAQRDAPNNQLDIELALIPQLLFFCSTNVVAFR